MIKTTVFLTDLAEYSLLNEVWMDCFGEHRPTRSAVEVSALPLGACVEVECWALQRP
ncbi:MAG: Rid family hydrolase [Actinobacteria bacterium]|nr:Rid family hydrolase [Actinomycetota bacterium]